MARDNRIVSIIESSTGEEAFIAFSITDDPEYFARLPHFKYYRHNPLGKTCFINHLIANKWNRRMRDIFHDSLLLMYPKLESSVWYRPRIKQGVEYNQKITAYFRRSHVRN